MGTTEAGTHTDVPTARAEGGSEWVWKLRVLALVIAFSGATVPSQGVPPFIYFRF